MPDTMALPRTALPAPVLVEPDAPTVLPKPATALPGDVTALPGEATALPGTTCIRTVKVPDTAPPYDDGHWVNPRGAVSAPNFAGPCLPFLAPVSTPNGQAALSAARPLTANSAAASRSPNGHWPSQFAQVLTETLAGLRPASQLAPWTTNRSRRRITQLGSALATPHRPRVRRVIVTSPASGVLEMSIIAIFGNRVRALAVRLERATPAATTGTTPGAATTGPPPTTAPAAGAPESASPAASTPESANPAAGWYCTAIEAA